MRFVFIFLFMIFSGYASSINAWENPAYISDYEQKKRQFKDRQTNILKARVKNSQTKKPSLVIREKGKLEHEFKQKRFKKNRTKDFLKYKKRYFAYQAQQKHILDRRLKELKVIRAKLKGVKKEYPDFEFLKTNWNK